MTAMSALASHYPEPQQLDPRASIKPVTHSTGERGHLRLQQGDSVIILTPTEVRSLLALTS
jgi:hypothetical protein